MSKIKKRKEDMTLGELADAAFLQASYQVVRKAKFYGTPVIIYEDGRIKEMPAEEMEARLKALEDSE